MSLEGNLRHIAILSLLCVPAMATEGDMPGGKDYADFPRVEGTFIAGYQFNEYGAGRFVASLDEKNQPVLAAPEGKRTRIIYLGQEAQSPLQMLRNYQKAFAGYGEYQERYTCQDKGCYVNMTSQIVWSEDNRIRTSFRNANSLYTLYGSFQKPMYAYGTITRGEKQFHVSVFTTYMLSGQTGLKNQPIVHLEVVEVEAFEPSLVFVEADEMINQITELGAIALYGIQFEFDSAALTSASQSTVAEVAKALNTDPGLSIYVVGHTDNAGTYDYNQKLSADRAASVVAALVQDHGIDGGRLVEVGVGPVAPVATNDTDNGRKLNRRVEIVKR